MPIIVHSPLASNVCISCERIAWISVKRMTVALLLLAWAAILPHGAASLDAGTEENITNAKNCTAELQTAAFKLFVDESCLVSLAAANMPGGKCPRDVAEDFLGAVFVQHGYVSLLVGPWAWAAYVILLGMTR
eukprot:82675-Amphidinium_carterae.1